MNHVALPSSVPEPIDEGRFLCGRKHPSPFAAHRAQTVSGDAHQTGAPVHDYEPRPPTIRLTRGQVVLAKARDLRSGRVTTRK
jgi:hypothetical protein